jgi:hypothetical protein
MLKRIITCGIVSILLIGLVAGCVGVRIKSDRSDTYDRKKHAKIDRKKWEKIGERKVNLKAEKDVITGIGKGRFNRIMIVVHDSAIEMYDIVITFGNGEKFSPKTRLIFAEDSRSREIDLPGKKRFIKKIEFFYRSRNVFTGRATVEVWGRK